MHPPRASTPRLRAPVNGRAGDFPTRIASAQYKRVYGTGADVLHGTSTDVPYGAIAEAWEGNVETFLWYNSGAICLRLSYAMSGTNDAYGATSPMPSAVCVQRHQLQ
eukprot:2972719-Rhodomonas_salina.1